MTASIRILRADKRAAEPWKNGGGITRVIAAEPAGAGVADFAWRVSMAEVRKPGPFSTFPGIDRILIAVEGVLLLTIDGVEHRVEPGSAPVVFAGEADVSGRALQGTALDLNLMVRRSRYAGHVRLLSSVDEPHPRSTVLAVFEAPAELRNGEGTILVGRLDAIQTSGVEWKRLQISSDGIVHVVEIVPLETAD